MSDDLEQLSKNELQDRARSVDVAVSGTKQEIIERLRRAESSTDADGSDGSDQQATEGEVSGAMDALRIGRRAFESASGLTVELAPGVLRDGDEWVVRIQAVETRRIPPSSDMVGVYDVRIDGDGEFVSLERTARGRRDALNET